MKQLTTLWVLKCITRVLGICFGTLLFLLSTGRVQAQGSGPVTMYYPTNCPNAGMTYTYPGSDIFTAIETATKDTIPLEWWPPSLLGGTITKTGLQSAAVMVRSRIMWNRLYPVAPGVYNYVSANLNTGSPGYNPSQWVNCTGYTMNTVANSRNSYGNDPNYQSNSATDSTYGNYVVSQGGVNPIATGFYPPIQLESTVCAEQSDDWRFCAISGLGADISRSQNRYAWRINTSPVDKIRFEAEAFNERIQPRSNHNWFCQTSDVGYLNKCYMRSVPNDGTAFDSNQSYSTLSPELRYYVAFPNAGNTTWYAWARGRGCGLNDDSFHIGLNNVQTTTADNMTGWDPCSYVWRSVRVNNTRPYVVTTPAGANLPGTFETVNLWMREDGMRVDRIIFATSASYDPNNDSWANQTSN